MQRRNAEARTSEIRSGLHREELYLSEAAPDSKRSSDPSHRRSRVRVPSLRLLCSSQNSPGAGTLSDTPPRASSAQDRLKPPDEWRDWRATGLGKHALERRAIRRLAVCGQHQFDSQVEQRTEPLDDVVTRHVLAIPEPDVQSVTEVGERVAADDRIDRRQPEDEIIVLAARERGDPNGHAPGP